MPRPISSNYLPSAFAAQSKDNSSDVWIRDSGASCHIMMNDTRKMYCGKPPASDQRTVTTSDGTRQRVEYIGNVDVVFHGRSDEPITLCDVSYVPGLRFNLSSFHKAQHMHVIVLDAAGAHNVGEILLSYARRVDLTCERADLRPVL